MKEDGFWGLLMHVEDKQPHQIEADQHKDQGQAGQDNEALPASFALRVGRQIVRCGMYCCETIALLCRLRSQGGMTIAAQALVQLAGAAADRLLKRGMQLFLAGELVRRQDNSHRSGRICVVL